MTKVILCLFFAAPTCAEVVSGSCSPERFIGGMAILPLALMYGCAALLIRELMVRWNLRWQVVFLTAAFAVMLEGLAAKTFFDVHWQDLQKLGRYGMWHGAQIPWAIEMLEYHSAISMLAPIALVHAFFPNYAHRKWLNKPVISGCILILIALTAIGFFFLPDNRGVFHPNQMQVAATVGLILALIGCAQWSKSLVPVANFGARMASWVDCLALAIVGFVSLGAIIVVPNWFATNHQSALTCGFVQVGVGFVAMTIIDKALFACKNPEKLGAAAATGALLFMIAARFIHR